MGNCVEKICSWGEETKAAKKPEEKKIILKVVNENGEVVLDQVELKLNLILTAMMKKVEEALGGGHRVKLMVKSRYTYMWNGIKLQEPRLVIDDTLLSDGDTVTAVLKPKPVPTVFEAMTARVELKADGTVVGYGEGFRWQTLADVQSVHRTKPSGGAFLISFSALRFDGTVEAWGWGPAGNCSKVQQHLVDVESIYATENAFAALTAGGIVVSWGGSCGDLYIRNFPDDTCNAAPTQLVDVRSVCSTNHSFAALKADGTVLFWGDAYVYWCKMGKVKDQLTNVQSIFSTNEAFAALKVDGSIVAWSCSKPQRETEEEIEEAKALAREMIKPMLVQVQVSEESYTKHLILTCHNMGGELITTVTLQPEDDERMLRQKIADAVHPPHGPASLHIVLPGGQRLRDLDTSIAVVDLLRLHYPAADRN